ncbi:MAG TPA: sulfurtransferase [Verrucomicrobiales bacterium]|nr:sulfurtransferase [Verrucomicrobiales bacterium]HIL69104.1 sulfurtransferase [Verrucomicrobiota bacterium]
MSEDRVVNIAGYKFVQLDELDQRREKLRELCRNLSMKGTILLSPEGINVFLAGSRDAIDDFLRELRSDAALKDFNTKESFSEYQPFTRMLVKVKKEIIAFSIDGIAPETYTSRRVTPNVLKQWMDEGRPVTMLDTRNQFEYEVGSFKDALSLDINSFRNFPKAVSTLPEDLKRRTVVTFCTGGIRCEKAGPFLEQAGFENVYQLDGGILQYFEDCGGEHYQGECFVFDKRVALDPTLAETGTALCYGCHAVLDIEDQKSAEYVPGEFCPYCGNESRNPYAD